MKKLIMMCALVSANAFAVKLSDYTPYKYEVLFTNPICGPYAYPGPISDNQGNPLTTKPKDVFCVYDDANVSGARDTSPQKRILDWVNDPETTELYITYLSFSNSKVKNALCENIKNRKLKVTLVMDQSQAKEKSAELDACEPAGEEGYSTILATGGQGGIGYAHNKIFMVNPHSTESVKIAFSSGNMSSGVVLHHENWNFITTSAKSYFAQKHVCLFEGIMNHNTSREDYRDFINECKGKIAVPEESDIKSYFVPGEGERGARQLANGITGSDKIALAAHRFSNTTIVRALDNALSMGSKVRMVFDDDLYWLGGWDAWAHNGEPTEEKLGDNLIGEFYHARNLNRAGAEVKLMETNHDSHLLHHNKYIIMDNARSGNAPAVWSGAGNFTNSAFFMSGESTNFENYYYITIPEVVESFNKQFDHVWDDLATSPENMPETNVLPTMPVKNF